MITTSADSRTRLIRRVHGEQEQLRGAGNEGRQPHTPHTKMKEWQVLGAGRGGPNDRFWV